MTRFACQALIVLVLTILLARFAYPAAGALAAIGEAHSLAVKSDGTIWAWGNNYWGQLGDGTRPQWHYTPVQVSDLSAVVGVATGDFHSMAVKADGTAWAWGQNSSGQLGDGTTTPRSTPVQVPGLSSVVAVSAGYCHSLVLKSDGTIWAWGLNSNGQLGDGTTTQRNAPVQVTGLTGMVAVSAGHAHSLAVKSDGTAWAWGQNSARQLGDRTTTQRNTPVQVSGLSGVVAVAAGSSHSLAVKSDGTAWAWGLNSHGQLGDGTTTASNIPVQVSGLSGVVAVAAGSSHSLAFRSDGTVWAWGYNDYGQLGDSTTAEHHSPVQVSGLTTIASVGAGGRSSLAVKFDGTVWTWGSNIEGQLGDDTRTQRTSPVQVIGITDGMVSMLSVTPMIGFASIGAVGGPFIPISTTYTLSNLSAQALNWTAVNTQPWVALSKTSGTLAPGGTDTVGVSINSIASGLAADSYNDLVTFTNTTNGQGDTTRPVSLTVGSPGVLFVTPATGLASTGATGGPFSPGSTICTLSNTGFQSVNWTADKTQSWVTLSKTAGTLAPGAFDTVTVSINSSANSLGVDSYSDTVSFMNTTNGNGNTTCPVVLTVTTPGTLSVTPTSGLASTGPAGGPFYSVVTYTVTNTGGQSVDWTADKTQPWVALSKTAGTLAPGASDDVSVSINSSASSLAVDIYSDTVSFTNTTNGNGNTTRAVVLTVATPGTLSVTPVSGLTSTGPAGGPFSPASTTYTLSNTGSLSLNWTASKTPFWVALSKANGTLAPGASDTVTVLVDGAANGMGAYAYSGTVSFTNTSNGCGNTSRPVALTVEGPAQPGPIVPVEMERYVDATGYYDMNFQRYPYSESAHASAFEVFSASVHSSDASQHSEIQPCRITASGSVDTYGYIGTSGYGSDEQGRSHFHLEFDVIRPVQFSLVSQLSSGSARTPSYPSFTLSGPGIATVEGVASTSGCLSVGRYSLNADIKSGLLIWPYASYTGSFSFDLAFSEIRGDINHDNYINVGDLQLLVAVWSSSSGDSHWNSDADLNSDGYVNVGDLQILVANWGSSL